MLCPAPGGQVENTTFRIPDLAGLCKILDAAFREYTFLELG
jgi:hypothetical protein